MELLILGRSRHPSSARYRGIDRDGPSHRDGLSEDHPVNRLFSWYYGQVRQGFDVTDLGKVVELVRQQALIDSVEHLEVVEITHGRNSPESAAADFLGYDLSSAGFSVLPWAVQEPAIFELEGGSADPCRGLGPIFRLIARYFGVHLNGNDLFADYEIASHCLSVVQALNRICPNVYENRETIQQMEIIALWKVFALPGD